MRKLFPLRTPYRKNLAKSVVCLFLVITFIMESTVRFGIISRSWKISITQFWISCKSWLENLYVIYIPPNKNNRFTLNTMKSSPFYHYSFDLLHWWLQFICLRKTRNKSFFKTLYSPYFDINLFIDVNAFNSPKPYLNDEENKKR